MMPISDKTLQQNRYRLVQQFGRDDEGITYEAFDNVRNTNVVLKEISISFSPNKNHWKTNEQQKAFADEAKILSSIQHESLPHVHDYFSETDRHYLVMEMINGKSLQDVYGERHAPFAFVESVDWASRILDALSYLHKNSPPVIHCAINPRNIKLTGDGTVKLLDVGQTRPRSISDSQLSNQSSEQADLHYLPLEQIWGGLDSASRKVIVNSYDERSEKILEQPPDARSDLYAVGATLYFLTTGKVPPDALTRSIELLEGNPDPLVSPSNINSEIPTKVSDVILRAMEIKRENRFDSAVIMLQILRSAVSQTKQPFVEKVQSVEVEPLTETVKVTVDTAAVEAAKLAERERFEREREREIFEQKRKEIEAEKQRLEEERRLVEQKKQEIEAERQRQTEHLARQLREVEEQKLLAEQRAVEAEKLLRDKQTVAAEEIFELDEIDVLEFDEEKSPVAEEKQQKVEALPVENLAPKKEKNESVVEDEPIIETATIVETEPVFESSSVAAAQAVETSKQEAASTIAPVEAGDLFADVPKESSSFKMVAIAAVVLLLVGGAVAWFMFGSKNQAVNPSGSGAAAVSTNESATKPSAAPVVEQTPVATTETTQASSETTPSGQVTDQPVTDGSQVSETKNSPSPNAPARSKKIAAPQQQQPAATSPKQKKSVTVDDIINDN